MNVGDRVRYTGKKDVAIYRTSKRMGTTGTVASVLAGEISVLWDGDSSVAGHYPENLEVIMSKKIIDTSKPLVLTHSDGSVKSEAIFGTLTSDGHILVSDTSPSASTNWIIFDTQGKFVRSSNKQGNGLTLANKVERRTRYYPFNPETGMITPFGDGSFTGYGNIQLLWDMLPRIQHAIRITVEGEKILEVEHVFRS